MVCETTHSPTNPGRHSGYTTRQLGCHTPAQGQHVRVIFLFYFFVFLFERVLFFAQTILLVNECALSELASLALPQETCVAFLAVRHATTDSGETHTGLTSVFVYQALTSLIDNQDAKDAKSEPKDFSHSNDYRALMVHQTASSKLCLPPCPY